jgi:hypothetical protein
MATGDIVVASEAFAKWIREANRKFLAMDMEAAGAALAAYRNDSADLLVIRGISDYADEHKAALDAGSGTPGVQDAWRRYAVRNAAEYLSILLTSSGFPWRDRPEPKKDGRTSRDSVASRASAAAAAAAGMAPPAAAVWHLIGEHHADPDGSHRSTAGHIRAAHGAHEHPPEHWPDEIYEAETDQFGDGSADDGQYAVD